MFVSEYKDDGGVGSNKDGLDTVLCTRESGRGMEGQFAGQTIKGRVRNRDGRGIVWQNEEQIWGNGGGRKENRVVENNQTRRKNL